MIESTVWSPAKKIMFRFWFMYAVLFILTNQFVLTFLIQPLLSVFVPWLGNEVLELDSFVSDGPNGSGDTTYNYLLLVILVIASLFIASIWSLLDRRRLNYQKLLDWLIVLIRYYIILQMFSYGLGKVFYLQMGPPTVAELERPLGDFSPMGLVWTFIGYSKPFTMLTGWLEVMGGTFLLFKRTQTLGAMIVFVVMSNVMAFNYFYDVPVKILSTHLVFMAIFLILLDGRRLLNLFILNKTSEPKEIRYLFEKPKWRKVIGWIKWSVVTILITLTVYELAIVYDLRYNHINEDTKIVFNVSGFKENNLKKREPKITDWKTVKLLNYRSAQIYSRIDKRTTYDVQLSDDLKTVFYESSSDKDSSSGTFSIKAYADHIYVVEGLFNNDTISARLKLREEFNLMKHEFRWVNETPDIR